MRWVGKGRAMTDACVYCCLYGIDENGGDAASHLSMLASYAAQGGGGGGDFRWVSLSSSVIMVQELVSF